jgi:MFS family permease
MIGAPMFLLVAVAVFYNVTGVGDSSIHSTTLTELTDPRYLGVAYSLRSLLGFGAGAISPWVFGLVLDWGRAGDLPDHVIWGLAWSTLGIGGLLGPGGGLAPAAHAGGGCQPAVRGPPQRHRSSGCMKFWVDALCRWGWRSGCRRSTGLKQYPCATLA